MIRGRLNQRREAIVNLRLVGSDGAEFFVDAIVDTGFSASLTLPSSIVQSHSLPRRADGNAELADGTSLHVDIYSVDVEWDGSMKEVLCYEMGDDALIGMRLLSGYELRIEVEPNGYFEIKKLDRK